MERLINQKKQSLLRAWLMMSEDEEEEDWREEGRTDSVLADKEAGEILEELLSSLPLVPSLLTRLLPIAHRTKLFTLLGHDNDKHPVIKVCPGWGWGGQL